MHKSKKCFLNIISIFIFSIIFLCISPVSAKAQEQPQHLKVGWYQVDGIMSYDKDGDPNGYCYDYYQELSRYMNVEYEYINGSWAQCMNRLRNGFIDVLAYAQYTEDRSKYFDFTETPMGISYDVLSKLSTNSSIIPYDYSTYEGKRVGVIRNTTQVQQLRDYMKQHNFYCKIITYEYLSDMEKDLKSGRLDLLLHTSLRVPTEDETVVEQFYPRRFYFAVRKGNTELLEQLNTALDYISIYDEEFSNRLNEKYSPKNSESALVFSPNESSILSDLHQLTIYTAAEKGYLSYENADNEEQGISLSIAGQIADSLNMPLDYREINSSAIEDTLQQNNTFILMDYPFDYEITEADCYLSAPYSTASYYKITGKNTPGVSKTPVIAIPNTLSFLAKENTLVPKDASVLFFENTQGCLDAVLSGMADYAYADTLNCDYLMNDYYYSDLSTHLINYNNYLCFAVYGKNAHEISLLLSKTINSIGLKKFSTLVIENQHDLPVKISLVQMLCNEPLFPISLLLFILLLCAISYLAVHYAKTRQREKDYDEIVKTKAHLEEIQSSMEAAISSSDLIYFEYFPNLQSVFCFNKNNLFHLPEAMTDFPESWFEKKITHPDDEPLLRESFNKIKYGASSISCEVRNLQDNKYHWYRYHFISIYDSTGHRIKVACTAQDITLQKETEKNNERQLRIMRQMNPNIIASFCLNLSTNECSNGISKSDFLLKLQDSGTVDGFFSNCICILNKYGDTTNSADYYQRSNILKHFRQEQYELSRLHSVYTDHNEVFFIKSIIKTFVNPVNGDILAIFGLLDVNAEIREELIVEHLVNTEYDYLATLDTATCKFIVQNIHQELVDSCPNNTDNYDTDIKAFILASICEADQTYCLNALSFESIINQLNNNAVYSVPFRQYIKGSLCYKVQRFSYLDHNKDIILITQIDNTADVLDKQAQMKQLEDALTKAQIANNAKTDFLSNMSHEIRTPMNSIIGMTQLSLEALKERMDILSVREMPLYLELKDYINKIDQSSHYLLKLINDILDVNQIESGTFQLNKEWIQAKDILNPCIDMIQSAISAKNLDFQYNVDRIQKDAFEYYLDSMKVRQMIMNLLNNACKFTAPGGHISMNLHVFERNDTITTGKLEIKDNGCGMSKDFLSKIFLPFEQEANPNVSENSGTGLGLTLARKIALAMNGDITVESELGKGSVFTITCSFPYRPKRECTPVFHDTQVDN